MNNNPGLIKVVELLKNEEETAEAIEAVIQQITNAASMKLYLEMTSAFTEEDVKMVEECKTQDESDTLMRQLYTQRTNTSPEGIVNNFLEVFSKTFIDKYSLDKEGAMEKPVEEVGIAPGLPTAPTM